MLISDCAAEGGADSVMPSGTEMLFSGGGGRAGRCWGPVKLEVSIVAIVVVKVIVDVDTKSGKSSSSRRGYYVVVEVVVVASRTKIRFLD